MDPSRVDLNRVDLNLLVAFDALMCERSVTNAARRLSVGQSAMSSTLARLRKLFGDPLLIRDGRKLTATPLAESLAKEVRDVLDQIESILSGPIDFDPAQAERTFSIMASDVVSIVLLKPLRARLAAEAPGVRVRVMPPAADDAERLRRNRADILITPREVFPDYQSFRNTFLFSDRLLCAVDVGNEAVGRTDVPGAVQLAAVPGHHLRTRRNGRRGAARPARHLAKRRVQHDVRHGPEPAERLPNDRAGPRTPGPGPSPPDYPPAAGTPDAAAADPPR